MLLDSEATFLVYTIVNAKQFACREVAASNIVDIETEKQQFYNKPSPSNLSLLSTEI